MTTPTSSSITDIVLSKEELLVILNVLNSGALPGIGADPVENLTPEQRAYGLIVAEQALRARGLARITESDHLQVRRDVLELIGTCAYAEGSQVVSVVDSPSAIGVMHFVYRRGEAFVLQTSPEPGLFRFEMYGARTAVLDAVLHICRVPDVTTNELAPIRTDQATVAEVRRQVEEGHANAALTLLDTESAPDASAKAFVNLLGRPHRITVFQNIHFMDEDSASVQSVTLVFDQQQIWLAAEDATADDQSQAYILQPTSLSAATTYLAALAW